MEHDRDQPPGDFLSGVGKGLLALALAEIELGGVGDDDLDHAVGQLPGRKLVEPDAVEARMAGPNPLENLMPEGRIEYGFRRDEASARAAKASK